MKNVLIVLLLLAGALFGKVAADNQLSLYVKANEKQVELKWLTKNYSSHFSYKLYKSVNGSKYTLIKTLKPLRYKLLKSRGYSDDYIFMIYPFREAKSINDKLEIMKIEQNVQGFRTLKFVKDTQLAKNLGQYYLDLDVQKDKIYTYIVEAYLDGKKVLSKGIVAHTYKQRKKYDFMWVDAKGKEDGVELNWDMQDEYAYFNIYRKLAKEKKFHKLNKNYYFISKKYANKSKYLYKDKTLLPTQKATYYIRKIDMFSHEGIASKKVMASLEKIRKKPSKVENIFILSSDKKITLRWQKSYDAKSYDVYRSTLYQGGFVKINKKPIKKEIYFDKNFQAGKTYYYYVVSRNKKEVSVPSITMMAFARDTTPPKRPEHLQAKTDIGVVNLAWSKVKENDIIGYRVYLSMNENKSEWSLVNKKVLKKNSFTHKRLKTLSRFPYYYRVTAVDATYNESLPSAIVEAKLPDVTPPEQPFIKVYRSYIDKISLEWNKISVYDFSHYNVYRKEKVLVKLNKKPLFQNIFIDTHPKKGINEYIITAVDKSSNESKKVKSKKIRLIDTQAVKITHLKIKRTANGVKVSFQCKDKDYAGFKLFRSSADIINYFNVSNFVSSKSYTDNTALKKVVYYYMVKAYDNAGNISESDVVKIK